MKERGILFSAPMVRAILGGRKTQTRRLVTHRHVGFIGGAGERDDPGKWGFGDEHGCWHVLDQSARPWSGAGVPHESYRIECPHGAVGDRLWVRETFALIWPGESPPENERDNYIEYRADSGAKYPGHWPDDTGNDPDCPKWRPSIHMPRWASRITLEITDVRVERLHEISEADALAEGMPLPAMSGMLNGKPATVAVFDPVLGFRVLWDSLNGERSPWESNPWVWVLSFRVLEPARLVVSDAEAAREADPRTAVGGG